MVWACDSLKRVSTTVALVIALSAVTLAADATFVGSLATIVEDDVAAALKIDKETLGKLNTLITDREDEALELVLKINDLPRAEQDAKLAPFVVESERRGLALLTDTQRALLKKVLTARRGMASLADAEVAEELKLSAEQSAAVKSLMEQRAADLERNGPAKRRTVEALYEGRIAALLTPSQRAAWEAMAGLASDKDAGPEPAGATPDDETKPTTGVPAAPDLPVVSGDGKIRFNFRFAPWKDVLDWFATQANLSLVLDATAVPERSIIATRRNTHLPRRSICSTAYC